MKPHEETLEVSPFDSRVVVRRGVDGEVVADVRVPLHENGREWSALFAAAPDMARALMDGIKRHSEHMNCACWTCGDARAALKKAGVLP